MGREEILRREREMGRERESDFPGGKRVRREKEKEKEKREIVRETGRGEETGGKRETRDGIPVARER